MVLTYVNVPTVVSTEKQIMKESYNSYCFLLLSTLIMCSCGVHNYSYDEQTNCIKSLGKQGIIRVDIQDTLLNYLGSYVLIEGKQSREFCLQDFGKSNFTTNDSISIVLEPGRIYLFDVFPKGDRNIMPLRLQVDSNGQFKNKLKGGVRSW